MQHKHSQFFTPTNPKEFAGKAVGAQWKTEHVAVRLWVLCQHGRLSGQRLLTSRGDLWTQTPPPTANVPSDT